MIRKTKIKNKILSFITPLLKKVYLKVFGNFFISRSSAIVLFSEFEKKEVLKYCKLPEIVEIIEEPILNLVYLEKKLIANQNTDNFYKKNGFSKYINIVYWGRLDYETKGIDRIIKALSFINSKEKLKIHLMGPDYNNGREKIEKFLNKMNLNDMVVIHESNIWKGTMKPLMDSDFSILASKADGFPRALRESVAFNIPIICSIETNFSYIIKKFNCGFVFENEKQLVEIFNRLKVEKNSVKKKNFLNAKMFLSEKSIALKLEALYKRVS